MKIAIISTAQQILPPPGYGSEYATYDLALELHRFGHEITVFAPDGSSLPGINTISIPGPFEDNARQRASESTPFWRHEQILKSQDVVHDLSITARTHELLMLSGFKKSIHTLNGISWITPEHPDARKNLVVVSHDAKKYALNGWSAWKDTPIDSKNIYCGEKLKSCEVVPYGCNTSFYNPSNPDVVLCHGPGMLNEFVLYVGRPHVAKGILPFIPLLAKLMPKLKFVLAWHASLKDHIEQELEIKRECAGIDNIIFEDLGCDEYHHRRKRNLMVSCSVFLHPAIYVDACPRAVIEAQACGAPVVAFRRGGIEDLIINGRTGVWIEYFEWWKDEAIAADAFANAIRLAKSMHSFDVVSWAKSYLSTERMAKDYLYLYRRVCDGDSW